MNRVYNNEVILMVSIMNLLKNEEMDFARSFLLTTLLVDRQTGSFVQKSNNIHQLNSLIKNQGLISRKLDAFGPYFLNAIIVLKQNEFIRIHDGKLHLGNSLFPNGSFTSKRLERIIKNSKHLLDLCHGSSTKELYNNLNIQL